MEIHNVSLHDKVWGNETWIVNNGLYCLKLLKFHDRGNCSSLHFHDDKTESWYVQSGTFEAHVIDTNDANVVVTVLTEGDVVTLTPLTVHQIVCTSDGGGTLIEVSTTHHDSDSYRVFPSNEQFRRQSRL
jgi:mannose-6-phosphate isomerase-like protein (cupin superfamily)